MSVSKLLEFKGLQTKISALQGYRDELAVDKDLQKKISALNKIQKIMRVEGISKLDVLREVDLVVCYRK
jgi:hypothetical protein